MIIRRQDTEHSISSIVILMSMITALSSRFKDEVDAADLKI